MEDIINLTQTDALPDAVALPDAAALSEALLKAKAELVCARLGVPAARVVYVLRLAELGGIDPLLGDDMIREAVSKVLADVPELRGGGTGASGAFRAAQAPLKDAFERGLEKE